MSCVKVSVVCHAD